MRLHHALLLCMCLIGCPHPTPTPVPPTNDATLDAAQPGLPSCPVGTTELPENVCDALFTADGHACVVCIGGKGCIDHSTEVYCITGGGCALDANCLRVVVDPGTPPDASASVSKSSAARARILMKGPRR